MTLLLEQFFVSIASHWICWGKDSWMKLREKQPEVESTCIPDWQGRDIVHSMYGHSTTCAIDTRERSVPHHNHWVIRKLLYYPLVSQPLTIHPIFVNTFNMLDNILYPMPKSSNQIRDKKDQRANIWLTHDRDDWIIPGNGGKYINLANCCWKFQTYIEQQGQGPRP